MVWALANKAKTEHELLAEATRWLLKLRDAPEESPLRKEFDAWLATSCDHRAAWDSISATWNFLGAAQPAYNRKSWEGASSIAPSAAASVDIPAARRHKARRWFRQPIAGAVMALAAACLIWVALPALLLSVRADFRTAAGETQIISLADGSTVELSASSAIRANVEAGTRHVTLLAGAAFFDVAKDAARPFIVDVEGAEVKVLGTAFDVQVSSATTTVALLRGSVEASSSAQDPARAVLTPGQMFTVNHATGAISVTDIPLEDIGAWREGKILLSGATVGEAIEIVQRYHSAWIAIPDRELASRKVSGLFDLRNPDRALSAIVGPFGGKVRSITPLTRVISRL